MRYNRLPYSLNILALKCRIHTNSHYIKLTLTPHAGCVRPYLDSTVNAYDIKTMCVIKTMKVKDIELPSNIIYEIKSNFSIKSNKPPQCTAPSGNDVITSVQSFLFKRGNIADTVNIHPT